MGNPYASLLGAGGAAPSAALGAGAAAQSQYGSLAGLAGLGLGQQQGASSHYGSTQQAHHQPQHIQAGNAAAASQAAALYGYLYGNQGR
jgi:hypothetical protein